MPQNLKSSAAAFSKKSASSRLLIKGMGAFGKVLQVRNKTSNKILAMKVISKRLLNRKSGYVENIHAERNILTRVRHPFVVMMHGRQRRLDGWVESIWYEGQLCMFCLSDEHVATCPNTQIGSREAQTMPRCQHRPRWQFGRGP